MISTDFFDFTSIFPTRIYALTSQQKFPFEQVDWPKRLGINSQSLAIPIQIHSNNVIWIDAPGDYENCDGLFTYNPQVVLSLRTADCIPIFLYDVVTGLRGLVHAGWRGVAGGIACNAIELMVKYESLVENIQIIFGPSICKHCFEVGGEVAEQFDRNCLMVKDKKYFADLHAQVTLQLLKYKISENNIYSSNICTFENQDCCSYRRDGENVGQMYSFMGVNNGFS